MFHSDKNMGKIKGSNKPFQGKKKGIRKNKNTKKKFSPQRKEVLNSDNIGKSCFDHGEESWNLESCSENASSRKMIIPEEDIN